MTTITINERSTSAKRLVEYLKTQSFVKVIEEKGHSKMTKEEFLADFNQSLTEVKEGKTKPLSTLFDGK
jgi:hypothetical protein